MTSGIRKSFEKIGRTTQWRAIHMEFYTQFEEVCNIWSQIAPKDNLFLGVDYLKILEQAPPVGMKMGYLLYFNRQRPVGIALCQIQYFKADQSLKLDDNKKTPCFFNTFARFVRGLVASKVEFNTLVCGNLLLTGEHGYFFDDSLVEEGKSISLLSEGLDYAQEVLTNSGTPIAVVLIKDFYEKRRTASAKLVDQGYNEFTIDPNMVMPLRENWLCFEDYLADLTSKYRVRIKRALKKSNHLKRRELDRTEVEKYLPRLYDLYRDIARNSGFNVVNLNKNYLLEFKRQMPETFRVFGYFEGERLIAFFSTIINGDELEAHFLGFEKAANADSQIYLNILIDILKIGIQFGVKRIVFARTALEIKSSLGAEAQEMFCYLRHRNQFSNRFLNPLLEYLKPESNFLPRHPFKGTH